MKNYIRDHYIPEITVRPHSVNHQNDYVVYIGNRRCVLVSSIPFGFPYPSFYGFLFCTPNFYKNGLDHRSEKDTLQKNLLIETIIEEFNLYN